MTELNLATAIPATTLAETLTASGGGARPGLGLVPWLGSLTPQLFDAPEAELTAIFHGAAVHDLGWLRRVAVRGEDRFRWLSGMVTNEVETLADRTGAYNLVLNAQGRIQGDLYVWREGDSVEMEITAEQIDALMSHFDRYIIMDDVELVPVAGESALGLTGPKADLILKAVGLPALAQGLSSVQGELAGVPVRLCRGYGTVTPHYALWTASESIPAVWEALLAAGATAVGAESLERLRVVEGIPAYGIDIQSRDLAQETAQTRALNFTKGCYLGQEIVERIRSRGQVHRHLRALELTLDAEELPAIGTELRIQGSGPESKAAGILTSVTSVASLQPGGLRRIFAIGMIRAEAEVGHPALTWPGGAARILSSPAKI